MCGVKPDDRDLVPPKEVLEADGCSWGKVLDDADAAICAGALKGRWLGRREPDCCQGQSVKAKYVIQYGVRTR